MIDWDYVTESISFGVDIGRNVTLFEDGLAPRMALLRSALAEGGLSSFRAEAHKLEGDLLTLGISDAETILGILKAGGLPSGAQQAELTNLEKWITEHIIKLKAKVGRSG